MVNKFQRKGDIKEGSVVLVREDNIPRMKWPVGLVTKVYPGRDGVVRSVQLKTGKGHLVRSIQRLHDLEIYHPSPGLANSGDHPVPNKSVSTEKYYTTRTGRVSRPVKKLDL